MSQKKKINGISWLLNKSTIYFVFIALIIVLAVLSPVFLTYKNLINVFRQISVIGIISVGMTFVIIAGGIDLSSGAVVAAVAVLATSFGQGDYPLILSYGLGLLLGLGFGLFNGLFIAKLKIAPFITTLATMTIARGFAMVYTDGRNVIGLSNDYCFIGRGSVGIIPIPVIMYSIVILLGVFLLNYTKLGRHIYAVGGNENSANVSGINVVKIKMICYIIAGLTTAIGAIILSARIQTGQPAGGQGYELDAIAASVIGGASLSGGIGRISGTVIGMLIIGVMSNGLDLLNVSSYYQQIIKGVIILVAVLTDRKRVI